MKSNKFLSGLIEDILFILRFTIAMAIGLIVFLAILLAGLYQLEESFPMEGRTMFQHETHQCKH